MDEKNKKTSVEETQKIISRKFLRHNSIYAIGSRKIGENLRLQIFLNDTNSYVVDEIKNLAPFIPIDFLPKSKAPIL